MASQLTTSSEKYHYRSLETPTTIRLLKILPYHVNKRIACTLEHFPEDELRRGRYSALSYCWGESKQNKYIYIGNAHGDKTMHEQGLHQNLREFLDQMFQTGHNAEYFWTDFLCLNQDPQDPEDREIPEQVRRMGEIYSEATRTISWLGRPDPSTTVPSLQNVEASIAWISKTWLPSKQKPQGPIEFFRLSSRSWHDLKNDPIGARALSREPSHKPQFMKLGGVALQMHMQNILRLPYWERIWIIQEVALAKEVDFIYGEETIGFKQFFLAYESYFYYHMSFLDREKVLSETKPAIEARDSVASGSLPIWEILAWGSRCRSSEPADRLYGLFGFLRFGKDRAHLVDDVKVDYKKDLSEIYWDVAFGCRLSRSSLPGKFTDWHLAVQDSPERSLLLQRRSECGWVPDYGEEFLLCWILLASLRDTLKCAGSFEALEKFAQSANVPRTQRDMALVARRLFSACRAMGSLRESIFELIGLEPISWSEIPEFQSLGHILLWTFLHFNKSDLPPEPEKVQAAAIGMLFELEIRKGNQDGLGRWECRPSQNVSSWPGNDQSIMRFKFLKGKMAQCCLHDYGQSKPTQQKCKGMPLFLDLPEIGFVLKFDFEAVDSDPDTRFTVVSIAAAHL